MGEPVPIVTVPARSVPEIAGEVPQEVRAGADELPARRAVVVVVNTPVLGVVAPTVPLKVPL